MYLFANIVVCACAFLGFIYGGIRFFRPKKALYAQMITLSLGCVTFGRLFNIVRLITGGNLTDNFQLGFLGVLGSLMFFFSANYGTIDSLADDGSKEFTKHRIIALVAPVAAIAIYVALFLFSDVSDLWKILGAVLTAFVMAASYFHLKHLIFPDVDFGVVKSLRLYNLLGLIYSVSVFVECSALSHGNEVLTLICCCVSGVVTLAMIPAIVKGVAKWKT